MKRLLLLGALALFAFTASAQSDASTSSEKAKTEKAKTEKVCSKTGKKCSETCANKKTGTCCEGKSDAEKKACSKKGEKKACSKKGDMPTSDMPNITTNKKGEKTPPNLNKRKGDKSTKTKTVGVSNK